MSFTLLTECYSVDNIKKNEICEKRGAVRGGWNVKNWVLVGLQEERDYFEETGVDRQTMLKWIFKK
jgi:hypothetical protein